MTRADVHSERLCAQRVWLCHPSHYLCLLWPFSHVSRATHLAFPASSHHPEAISKGFICPPQIGTTHHRGSWNRHTRVVVSRTDHVGPKTVVFCEEWLLSKGTLDKIIIRLLGGKTLQVLNPLALSLWLDVSVFWLFGCSFRRTAITWGFRPCAVSAGPGLHPDTGGADRPFPKLSKDHICGCLLTCLRLLQ